jgi:hypothetical protein
MVVLKEIDVDLLPLKNFPRSMYMFQLIVADPSIMRIEKKKN